MHQCSRCQTGFPPENDGSLPWKREDGTWDYGCPWSFLEDAVRTLERFADWKVGIHPVSTGRAPWLPGPFEEAMRFCRTVLGG